MTSDIVKTCDDAVFLLEIFKKKKVTSTTHYSKPTLDYWAVVSLSADGPVG